MAGDRDALLAQVLHAIALNRRPGFHFAGNFLGLEINTAPGSAGAELVQHPHLTDARNEIDVVAFGVFLDLALGSAVRAALDHYGPMATTTISLALTGAPRRGTLKAASSFCSPTEAKSMQQLICRTDIRSGDNPVGFASGTFVRLPGDPLVPRMPDKTPPPTLELEDLDEHEALIFTRAEKAASGGATFVENFWGGDVEVGDETATLVMQNGPHIANRLGRLQGGVQVGMVLKAAAAALGAEWMPTHVDVHFLRPGDGDQFRVAAEIVHRGRTTAVVVSRISDGNGRQILQACTAHAPR